MIALLAMPFVLLGAAVAAIIIRLGSETVALIPLPRRASGRHQRPSALANGRPR
jgi:hypothetical protein